MKTPDLKPEDIGTVVTLQVFDRIDEDTIDSSSLRKSVGTLEYYAISKESVIIKFVGLHPVKLSLEKRYLEVWRTQE